MQHSIPVSHSKVEFCRVQKLKGKLVSSTRTPRRSISHLHRAKSIDREIYFKGTGSRCLLEGHVKDNYYARFQTRSYL